MSWPEYMAQLLNRLTALTDPKAVVSLKAGDMVIVEGFQKVRPKMKVKALHYIPKPTSDTSELTDQAKAVQMAAN